MAEIAGELAFEELVGSAVTVTEAAPVGSVIEASSTAVNYGSEYLSTLPEFGEAGPGSWDQVGSLAGNSDFVTATDPSSITQSASASNFGPTTQIFDDGSTLTTAADGTISATSAPSYTLETLQFQAGQAFDSLSASVKEAFSPANINKVAKDVGINLAKQTVGQVIGAVAPPA